MNDAPRREGFIDNSPADIVGQDAVRKVAAPVIEPSPAEEDAKSAETIPQETWPIVVKLLYSKNVRDNNGNTLTELSFREPRGGDINRYGNPCRINQEGDVLIEERKMTFIMSALCGILPPFLENLDPRDWNSCAYRLRGFFLPDLRAW